MGGSHRKLRWAIACVAPLLLGACAATRDAALPIQDPSENLNRQIMTVNQETLRPASEFVKAAIPGPVAKRLRDFNSNLKEPRIFVNNILQGRVEAAVHTTARFAMNSIFVIGGMFDIATGMGIQQQSGDFGQTLFMWGLGSGPYLVLPFFGPSNMRDGVGLGVDLLTESNLNPLNAAVTDDRDTVNFAIGFMYGIDLRARNIETLDAIEANSIDFYSTLRSVSQQHREADLRKVKGLEPEIEPLEDPEAPENK